MSTFKKFEDMEVWQEARSLAKDIYAISNQGEFFRDYGFKDQIRRAAVSVSSNIAEGSEREGAREFIHFLSIARGSVSEVRSQLFLAEDIGYISRNDAEPLRCKCTSIIKMLTRLSTYLEGTIS